MWKRKEEKDMNVIDQITAELERATVKFPTWPTDPLHALAVLGEEYGELTKAMLQLTYEPHKTTPEEVRAEAIQTAAMALRLAMSLDRYEYRRGEQHKQISEGDRFIGLRVDQLADD
jgi:NTP pyrophosphatase (non-canonical NTP hydrolase)